VSTALYRRYRPETFADVIGQEHVTAPLMAAIDKDRINHAYLFSGPRGCGKTTSARILARCLNCAQGPTSTPCGTCDSCVELARDGSGSLDVIEIDAASHGGVDDARDLRERATFAPVRDRFKIFIIDEAHMVTSAGFNALLKIVEEPPEHILFIFATTEPDKVIGTIRSRTHHYPFRLVPPEPLMAYLELLCRQENVPVAPGVLSLVIRAGGGSVRDSLSVLDQLMAGAGEAGLDYELAVSLLGYTHATLLDDVVDSVAAGDAATVFNAVDRVIQTGHDPRRFVEDLLERFRDLIVISAVPEGAASILRGVPDDQLNRMRTQANQLGAGELSRAADVTNTALTDMTGATSPRLHLELLCARLLLPAADATDRGTLARVDRIERRLEYAAGAPSAEVDEVPRAPARPRLDGVPRTAEEAAARWSLPAADPAASAGPPPTSDAPPVRPAAGAAPDGDSSPDWGGSWGVSTETAFSEVAPSQPGTAAQPGPAPAPSERIDVGPFRAAEPATAEPAQGAEVADPAEGPRPDGHSPASEPGGPAPVVPNATAPAAPMTVGAGAAPAASAPQQGQSPAAEGTIEMVRRAWPEIMDEVAKIKRATWLIVNLSAKPRSFEGNQLVLAFAIQGNAIGFQRGPHMDNLRQAIHKVLGLTCSIEAVHDAGESGPKVPASQAAPGSTRGHASAPTPVTGESAVDSDAGAPAAPELAARGPQAPSAPPPTSDVNPSPTARTQPAVAPATPPRGPDSGSKQLPLQSPAPSPARATGTHRVTPAAETAQDTASAWDPSMSDDSWALVEPPEEAFDSGAGWGAVPEDPDERRAGTTTRREGAGRAQPRDARPGPAVSRAAPQGATSDPAPDRRGTTERTPDSADPAPASRGDATSTPDSPATAPAPSRSVVWSPPATTTPAPVAGGTPSSPAGASAQGRSPTTERSAPIGNARPKPVSRYQQLLDEAERKRAEETAASRGAVDLRFVEDEPSADDEAIEESGLVGRTAIEHILNGRLIEDRGVDGP